MRDMSQLSDDELKAALELDEPGAETEYSVRLQRVHVAQLEAERKTKKAADKAGQRTLI